MEFIAAHEDHLVTVTFSRNLGIQCANKSNFLFIWFLDTDIVCAPMALSRLMKENIGMSAGFIAIHEVPKLKNNNLRGSRFKYYIETVKGGSKYSILNYFEVDG